MVQHNCIPCYLSKQSRDLYKHNDVFTYFYGIVIHICPTLKPTKMSFNSAMPKKKAKTKSPETFQENRLLFGDNSKWDTKAQDDVEESYVYYGKWEDQSEKIAKNTNTTVFWKRQSYRDSEKISGCPGRVEVRWTGRIQRSFKCSCNLYMYNTKSGPECKL